MGKKDKIKKERKIQREQQQLLNKPINNTKSVSKTVEDPNDLFNNPMTRAAMEALSEEDKEKYKKIGEHLYGRINFENGKCENNIESDMLEAAAYIKMQLDSGIHPSHLDDNEKNLMKETYGDKWYVDWNYVEQDLNDIVTLKH